MTRKKGLKINIGEKISIWKDNETCSANASVVTMMVRFWSFWLSGQNDPLEELYRPMAALFNASGTVLDYELLVQNYLPSLLLLVI